MITILDFGLGNVSAFTGLFDRLGVRCATAKCPSEIVPGSKFILPGVGAFDMAMERLEKSGLAEALKAAVTQTGTPVLGVCVGMQVLFEGSDEGNRAGLGLLPGRVVHMGEDCQGASLCLPHLGWNTVSIRRGHPVVHGLNDAEFYFLHSYRARPARADDVIAGTTYGCEFPSIVGSGPVIGIQCHPEKSHESGIRLLQNFAAMPSP